MRSLEVKKTEILAPAGDPDSFFAAINNGCNAVYLGVGDFNARIKAKNFTLENLEFYITYAHLMNVKVYLTLNTLVLDSEIEKITEIIKAAIKMNIDAFIVQDLGVFFIIKKICPDISVHASTQLGICNLEGALFCQKLGFSRIILARETSLLEIARITKNCNIETEAFVHGALCVSVSGQCYLSSFIFAESGNRGKCLQPCRKYYSVLKNDNKVSSGYMLSTSDLCLADKVLKLKELNVTSFKIEGRLKRPEYVAECVKLYKNILDNNEKIDLVPVKKLYNRGNGTSGYLFDDNNLMYKTLQGHMGVCVGKVLEKYKDKILIESNIELSKNDGFKILDKSNCETGNGIFFEHKDKNLYLLLFKGNVSVGDFVNITTDYSQIEEINEISKKIDLDLEFNADLKTGIKIKVKYIDKYDEFLYDIKPEEAKSHPLDYKTVFDAFNKLKTLPFKIASLTLNCDNVFIPLSKLNEFKKDVIDKLSQRILEKNGFNRKYNIIDKTIEFVKFNSKNINIAIVDENLIETQNFDCIVFKPKNYNKDTVNGFLEKYKNFSNKFLYIPPFLTKKDIDLLSNLCEYFSGFYLNNPGHLELDFIKDKKIIIGDGFNILNKYAIKLLENFDIYSIVLSREIELNKSLELNIYSKFPTSIFVYGNLEAMQLNHCVVRNIYNCNCKDCKYTDDLYFEDERKGKFKIYRRVLSSCYFILNNKKLNALNSLKNEKIGFVFDFSFDNTLEIAKIQEYYAEKFIKKTNPNFDFTNYTKGNLFRRI